MDIIEFVRCAVWFLIGNEKGSNPLYADTMQILLYDIII